LELDVLTHDQALHLLASIAGSDRLSREASDANEIVELCGGLPLAIRIVGARLVVRTDWMLRTFANRLRDERARLDVLRIGDLDVRSSFQLSYQAQDEMVRRAFCLLGSLDTHSFAGWVLGALLLERLDTAEDTIDKLIYAQLLEPMGVDVAGQQRYRLHDLLRAFGRERLREQDRFEARSALARAADAYVLLAQQADAALGASQSGRGASSFTEAADGTELDLPLVAGAPVAWFESERSNLVPLVRQAAEGELYPQAWRLAEASAAFLENYGYWTDWQQAFEYAVASARKAGDRTAEAVSLRHLGNALNRLGQWERAERHLKTALGVLIELGDRLQEAHAHVDLGRIYRLGRWSEAESEFTLALHIFTDLGDEPGQGLALANLGDVYHLQGLDERALESLGECLTIARKLGDKSRELSYCFKSPMCEGGKVIWRPRSRSSSRVDASTTASAISGVEHEPLFGRGMSTGIGWNGAQQQTPWNRP
jgi:tetratricopeptide (TPR) repeat protein